MLCYGTGYGARLLAAIASAIARGIVPALVFAGLLFSLNLFNKALMLKSVAAFAIFCLASSAVYLLNDLVDREKDRQHPTKKNRPLASGALSPQVAIIAIVVLSIVALASAVLLNQRFAAVIVGYRGDAIRGYFGSGDGLGIRLEYFVQETQDGTGKAAEWMSWTRSLPT